MAESATVARRPRGRALEAERTREARGFRGKRVLGYALLILLSLLYIAPLLWMFSSSLKTNIDATAWPVQWIPAELSTQGYDTIFNAGAERPVMRWFVNSLLAATLHAALVLAVATPAGYALARMDFRGRRFITALIIGTIFVPPVIFLVPNFLIADAFGMVDTLAAVIIPYAGSAFGVFFMRQFFQSLPHELEEAALVDGATYFQAFRKVVIPLAAPGLVTAGLLVAFFVWNEFLFAITLTSSQDARTVPASIAFFTGSTQFEVPLGTISAASVVISIPLILMVLFFQKRIVAGLTAGAVKG